MHITEKIIISWKKSKAPMGNVAFHKPTVVTWAALKDCPFYTKKGERCTEEPEAGRLELFYSWY